MENQEAQVTSLLTRRPSWIAFIVTVVASLLVTALLTASLPYLPLGKYPFLYVLLTIAIAYYFGAASALLVIILGLVSFGHLFNSWAAASGHEAISAEFWASLIAWFVGMLVGSLGGLALRSSHTRVRHLMQQTQELYHREHRVAEMLQSSLLEDIPDRVEGFSLDVTYHAALDEARIGGDFYDVFCIGDGKAVVVLGDVSGKGLKAAVQVAAVKYSLRNWGRACSDPSIILKRVNDFLVLESGEDGFVSVFVGILDYRSRSIAYANGGHEPALLWKSGPGEVNILAPTGPILGVMNDAVFGTCVVSLEPQDEVLLGTDGLLELCPNLEFSDIAGLARIYSGVKHEGTISAAEFVRRLAGKGGPRLRDDVAVMRIGMD